MKNPRLAFLSIALTAGLLGCSRIGVTKSDVAATVGDRKITVSEIDAAIQADLARIESEKYDARKNKLDQLIEETLIADKAKALGVTSDELLQREVTQKAKTPTDEDVKAAYEKIRGQVGPFEQVQARIREMLSNQGVQARRAEYLNEIRKEARVEIHLDPPRIPVDVATGTAKGPEGAPITLVEFSDYQCPFCARSQGTVDQVLSKYSEKIRHVFMDFPLVQIHPQAQPASVASRCAGAQGKFWEFHKVLFERQKELSADNYKKWAGELGLDGEKFAACLDSKQFDAAIQQSVEAGKSAGITGTPGFLVNGVAIKGAQPVEVFISLIDEELARKK